MKYSKTTLMELSHKYKNILIKCAFLNAAILLSTAVALPASAETETYTGHTGIQGALSDSTGANITKNNDVVFKNNTTTDHGAGLYYKNGTSDTAVIFNSDVTFLDNEVLSSATSGSGAGIFVSGGNVSLLGTNNTFTNNKMNATISDGRKYKVGGGAIANQSYQKDTAPDKDALLNAVMIIGTADSTNIFTGNNSSTNGGAIMNRAVDTDGDAHLTINGKTTFSGNEAVINGGAIYNIGMGVEVNDGYDNWSLAVRNSTALTEASIFNSNTAGSRGGAIYNAGEMTLNDATFTSNRTTTDYAGYYASQGGAIYNAGADNLNDPDWNMTSNGLLVINGATFGDKNDASKGNSAIQGGAIANSADETGFYIGELTLNNTNFYNNKARADEDESDGYFSSLGGAIWNGDGIITVNGNTEFEANIAKGYAAAGGAIWNNEGEITFNDSITFASNMAQKTIQGNGAQGGAIDNSGIIAFNDVVNFQNNKATNEIAGPTANRTYLSKGGALYNETYGFPTATITFENGANFEGNQADLGGAVFNSSGVINLTDTSFKDNIANYDGAAIFNAGTINLAGTNTFSGNTANGSLNDIYNTGILNIAGALTLDGGVVNTDDGVLNFKSGTTLTLADVLSGSTIISGGKIYANGATLDSTSFVVSKADTYTFATSTFIDGDDDSTTDDDDFKLSDSIKTAIDNNLLYDITYSKGTFTVAEREGSDIAEDVIAGGATAQEANTVAAVAGADSTHPVVNAITSALQTGNVAAVAKAAEDLAPTTSQQVMGIAQSVNTLLNNVTGTRMAALGKAGGDAFIGGSTWVQGLYNHSKQDASGNNAGFSANTKGIAFGIDGKINEAVTIGLGYGYTKTDADSRGRDVDVDGHNFFIYGQYQPDAWYVNTMLSYGLNKYEEKKSPMGVAMKAKYDVNTFAANVMTGYDFDNGITPEGGLRYVLADQDSYNDGAQRVSTDKNDVLTAVMGVKYSTNVKAEDWTFKPTLRLAATYDVVSDNSKANVNVTGGSNYQITGDRLHRFGVETGVGVTSSVKDWDLTLEYNGGFRKDFQSHTGMLKATYHF